MGNLLKQTRESRKWSQSKLSIRSGVPQTTISAIERESIVPTITIAKKLADAMGCTIDELFVNPPGHKA